MSLAASILTLILPAAGQTRDAQHVPGVVPELLPDRRSARAVGMRYLALVPAERDPHFLQRAVFGDIPEKVMSSNMSLLRSELRHKREREFRVGDTVILDGWIVSRTEARLCALAALDHAVS